MEPKKYSDPQQKKNSELSNREAGDHRRKNIGQQMGSVIWISRNRAQHVNGSYKRQKKQYRPETQPGTFSYKAERIRNKERNRRVAHEERKIPRSANLLLNSKNRLPIVGILMMDQLLPGGPVRDVILI